MRPADSGSRPNSARLIASCPAPRRPTRPSTSPRRTCRLSGPALPLAASSSSSTDRRRARRHGGAPWPRRTERLADDQAHQLGFGAGARDVCAWPTSAPSRITAARSEMRHHLVEPVRHVDHRHALRAQAAQHARTGARRRSSAGWPRARRAPAARACTSSARPMASSDFSARVSENTRRRGVDVAAHARHHAARRGVGRAPVDQAEAARVAHAQADVLGHRHPLDQAEVLVDEGDRLALPVAAAPFGSAAGHRSGSRRWSIG